MGWFGNVLLGAGMAVLRETPVEWQEWRDMEPPRGPLLWAGLNFVCVVNQTRPTG